MRRLILAASAAIALTFSIATPASAGDGSSDYYFKKTCSVSTIGGITMHVSTWDVPSGGRYHIGWTRSGVAWTIASFVINGKSYGPYINPPTDLYITLPDRDPHTVKAYVNVFGQYVGNCSVKL